VTVVTDRVAARVDARARFATRRWRRPTINRRTQHLRFTVAPQLLEGNVGTSSAVAAVANILTPVVAARERFVAGEIACVVNVDAAELSALVPAAASLLVAPTIAARVVRTTRKVLAIQLLVHRTTTATNLSGQWARWAFSIVTSGLAGVVFAHRSASQLLSAHLTAAGHRIQARLPLLLSNLPFPAKTRLDCFRRQRARLAVAFVTIVFAGMVSARQRFPAFLAARKMRFSSVLLVAFHRFRLRFAAVTRQLDLLRARRALSLVTLALALVIAAVQKLGARLTAELLRRAALDRPLGLSARTASIDDGDAWRAGTRMAKVVAAMNAKVVGLQRLAADFAAGVWRLPPVVWRVDGLAAEAAVVLGHRLVASLTPRTPPTSAADVVVISISVAISLFHFLATLHFHPLLDAVDVKYLETLLLAVPGCVCRLDLI